MNETEVIIQQTGGQINCNFEEIKGYLSAQLEEYRTAVFTDDSIKMAKTVVADLRKQQKAFKDRISEVKKAYMKPFDDFKAQADELVLLYNEPIEFINTQVEDFVARQKEEKREVIKELYSQVFNGLEGFPLEKIYNPRWENATYKKSEVLSDLTELKNKIDSEMQTILTFRSDSVEKAMELYRNTLSLQEAIAYIQRYETTRNEVLAKEREAELERARAAEREKILAEQKAEEEKAEAVALAQKEAIEAYAPTDIGAPEQDFVYSIKLTAMGKESLEMYMDSVGIEWEVLN